MWGYGGALTESCVMNLNRLAPDSRNQLLREIFSVDGGAGFSYLRIPLGGNDFTTNDFSLDDTADNQPDPDLKHFDFSREAELIPYMRLAKQLNPEMRFIASPWSPPAWMKIPARLDGGTLNPDYFDAYAKYLLRALEEFDKNGVPIEEVSIQNEPLIKGAITGWGYPQMYMSPADMTVFLRDHFVPLLEEERKAGKLKTRIFLHDHNWDVGQYVGALLDDKTIRAATDGVAFHCYGGTPQQMAADMVSHPDVPTFNTECASIIPQGETSADFQWWLRNMTLDPTRLGLVGATGWNLCLDDHGGPHNTGGCQNCRGLVTIDQQGKFTFNTEYDAIAQISRYVRRGAVRVGSTDLSAHGIGNAAFRNPDGSVVVVVRNENGTDVTVGVHASDCEQTTISIPAGGAVSILWRSK